MNRGRLFRSFIPCSYHSWDALRVVLNLQVAIQPKPLFIVHRVTVVWKLGIPISLSSAVSNTYPYTHTEKERHIETERGTIRIPFRRELPLTQVTRILSNFLKCFRGQERHLCDMIWRKIQCNTSKAVKINWPRLEPWYVAYSIVRTLKWYLEIYHWSICCFLLAWEVAVIANTRNM